MDASSAARTSIEKMNIDSESRLLFPDLLRVVAILAVISIHVHTSLFFNYNSEEPFKWWVSNILFSGTKWAVPVFVMLSGAFVLNPEKSFTFRSGLFKRVLKLLIPLIAWTIICKLFAVLFLPTAELSFPELFVTFAKSQHLTYHLWFLYMLLGLYLISPIIRAFIKMEPESILIVITASFAANGALMLFLYFDIERVVYNPLYYFTGFIFYFLSGYYLLRTQLKKVYASLIYALGIVAFLIGVVMNYTLLQHEIIRWDIFIDNLSPVLMVISVAVFLFFRRTSWQRLISGNAAGMIRELSDNCYGIYLVHTIILGALRYYFNFKVESVNIFVGIFGATLVIFLASFVIVKAIKKVKYLKKIIP